MSLKTSHYILNLKFSQIDLKKLNKLKDFFLINYHLNLRRVVRKKRISKILLIQNAKLMRHLRKTCVNMDLVLKLLSNSYNYQSRIRPLNIHNYKMP
jgi:hypothetical protein